MAPPALTVLTVTHNRRHTLGRLWKSLIDEVGSGGWQGGLEWVVIDDGSIDGTGPFLSDLARRQPALEIRQARQPHGGKHRGLLSGFRLARGDWIVVVDSDDWITQGALARVSNLLQSLSADPELGVVFAPLHFPTRARQRHFVRPNRTVPIPERFHSEPPFEASIIFRRAAVAELTLPDIPGELYLAERLLVTRLAENWTCHLADISVAHAEYQPDGLSARSREIRAASPIGAMMVYESQIASPVGLKLRIRAALNFGRYAMHARRAGRDPAGYGLRPRPLAMLAGWPLYVADRIIFGIKRLSGRPAACKKSVVAGEGDTAR